MSFFQKNKEIFIAAGIIAGGALTYLFVKGVSGGNNWIKKLKEQLALTANISEIGSNAGFSDANFQKELVALGWQSGWSWCVMYSKYVWSKILPKKKWDVAKNLIVVNSQNTWTNFDKDKSGYFKLSKTPKIGSIAIWKSSQNPANGHAGIVYEVHNDYFMTQEGNYGTGVGEQVKRTYNWDSANKEGLVLRGFINVV
jgi:hypothetical protein